MPGQREGDDPHLPAERRAGLVMGHSTKKGWHILPIPTGSLGLLRASIWLAPTQQSQDPPRLPCRNPLPRSDEFPTIRSPTLALVVAGNPSVMAGRETALCKANWARELSCIIRRWARGACTKHDPSVSCSGNCRAQHGTSSLGQAAEVGGPSPSCLREHPGPGAPGTHIETAHALGKH